MRDILLPKGMWSESHDAFKFWEISDNISEMMQDRDIVATEEILCGLSNGTIANDLEGHLLFKDDMQRFFYQID